MEITPLLSLQSLPIDAYGAGYFVVRGQRVEQPILLRAESYQAAPAPQWSAVNIEMIQAICQQQQQPEVLLLGVGDAMRQPLPRAWREVARAEGVVLEAMTTGAACRTWNVLLGEGRQVVALLYPLE